MTKTKIPGGTLSNGQMQLHQRPGRIGRSAPPGAFRKFGEKNLQTPETVIGQTRQTTGALHPYLHGQKLCDEPNNPDKLSHGKQVPVTFGQGSRDKGAQEADGFALLQEAGRLGAPVGGWKK